MKFHDQIIESLPVEERQTEPLFYTMTDQEKAKAKLDEISALLNKTGAEFEETDKDVLKQIRELPNGTQKEQLNEIRNKYKDAFINRDKNALNELLKTVRNLK